MRSYEQHEIVRSVSLDRAGIRLAVGCDDGRCVVYNLKNVNHEHATARTLEQRASTVLADSNEISAVQNSTIDGDETSNHGQPLRRRSTNPKCGLSQ